MSEERDDRSARITAMFAGEVVDRTRTLEEGLLAIEQAGTDERRALLEDLARAAHTLKGSAAMMGAPTVAAICHELEDTLGTLGNRGSIEPAQVTRLLAEVDRVREAAAEVAGLAPPRLPEEAVDREALAVAGAPARRPDVADPGAATTRLPTQKLDTLVRRAAELRAATTSLVAVSERLATAERELQVRRHHPSRGADDGRDAWSTAAAAVGDLDRSVRPLLRSIDRATSGIDAAVRDTVTVPVAEACAGLQRAVRDIAGVHDRRARLRLSVGDAEIDRRAVGIVRDALLHLVRNAADHGIEPPRERVAAGKPEEGTIEVRATVRGDRVIVTVGDDGRGVDTSAVRAAADTAGLATDTDPHELVFTAGLSTATTTTDISGRGVGLDAVRAQVESLRGSVTLRSQPGQGTQVTLTVPASLATARALLVDVAGEVVALLLEGVQRLIRVRHDEILLSEGRTWVRHGDGMLPVMALADLAGLPTGDDVGSHDRRSSPAVVVTGSGRDAAALLVDEVRGEQELLVQPLGTLLRGLPGIVGAGVLARGQVVLLLHPTALVRSARRRPVAAPLTDGTAARPDRGRVLLVEDAPTTRALEQGLLEAAGYDVLPASDGREAWALLRTETVDIVVSDVEMPGLDGLALSQRIRQSPALRELPIILVTSRDTDEDRRRGAEAGADAYLVKSSFAQGDLTAAIARMLA